MVKRDLIPLALYQIIIGRYKKTRAMEKELEEHLKENYILKDTNNWDFESLISDSIYGNEEDTEAFLKNLKKMATRKIKKLEKKK